MGLIQDLILKTAGKLNKDFTLSSFDFEISSGRFHFSAQGSVSGNVLSVNTHNFGSTKDVHTKIKERLYASSGIVNAAYASGMKPGDEFNLVVSMGIGFGAAYPDFKSENPAQTVTSFGGLLFMMMCAGYVGAVIIIEAGPVYRIFMADVQGKGLTVFEWVWVIGSFALVFSLSIAAVLVPMKFGEKRLSKMLI